MLKKTISGTLLISGTTIGAGMLGIPLLTAQAGFLPAAGITVLVWLFMLATGFLYLETTLWMHEGANVLSMTNRFLGKGGKWISGFTYCFLYYCLMVAYFAAGAPIFTSFLSLSSPVLGYLIYGLVFGGIVVLGMKMVDRINYILMVAMILSYVLLVGIGIPEISHERLFAKDWGKAAFAAPILFSAFGYHNIIPSLATHFNRDVRVLRYSIFWGTLIPLVIYLVWQWLIIGVVPISSIQQALVEGKPATAALQTLINSPWITTFGQFFAFFAIVTSMLGVGFSLIDFLADGFRMKANRLSTRSFFTLLVFVPPFLFSVLDPAIFVTAIGFAGGFGEAFLNGLLPVANSWIGRYRLKLKGYQLAGNKPMLVVLFVFAIFVMILETVLVLSK